MGEWSANTITSQAPVPYAPGVRGTVLAESRTVKDRVYGLGVAYWMTGDTAYAECAWTELDTVANNTLFPDGHPAHFLDTLRNDARRRHRLRLIVSGLTGFCGMAILLGKAPWNQNEDTGACRVC